MNLIRSLDAVRKHPKQETAHTTGLNLNYVVANGYFDLGTQQELFGDEEVTYIGKHWDMLDILANAGVWSSRTQAKKNWSGPKEIPDGYTEHKVGRGQITVWKPTR